ncbi:MAG: hypothetical protein H0W02_09170 [Ktedonobacteraceae bacterium]|nr:hypothetical protein [Ktedonobacteraceae bacterium]
MADERQPLVVTTRIDEERKALFTTFLEQHGCVVEDQGEFLRVHFPEGTQREAVLSGRDERHSITLPDKTQLVEVYIRQREYTILNIPAGETRREGL